MDSAEPTMSPQEATVTILVTAAGIDGDVSEDELRRLRTLVGLIPLFYENDSSEIRTMIKHAIDAHEHLGSATIPMAARALDAMERETAFRLACEIVLTDRLVGREEAEHLRSLASHLALEEARAETLLQDVRERNAGAS